MLMGQAALVLSDIPGRITYVLRIAQASRILMLLELVSAQEGKYSEMASVSYRLSAPPGRLSM